MRGDRHVLHDINLSVQAGEHIALMGPNGCGKSTLLKTMTCELYPLADEKTRVRIFGRERWDLTELKKKLGVVQNEIPGKPMLKMTGRDAVLTGFFSSSTLWPNLVVTPEMKEHAEAVMEQIDAMKLREHIFGEMSAGQQRRILIGRALVASSGCLLLDEPSNALDLSAQRDLRVRGDHWDSPLLCGRGNRSCPIRLLVVLRVLLFLHHRARLVLLGRAPLRLRLRMVGPGATDLGKYPRLVPRPVAAFYPAALARIPRCALELDESGPRQRP